MVELDKIECMDNMKYLRDVPSNFVDLVVTDPPYNISQKKDIRVMNSRVTRNFGEWDFGFDPRPVLKELKRVLKPNGQIYVFCATKQVPLYMEIFEREWFFRNIIVWYKRNPVPCLHKCNYLFANDYIIYAINEKVKPKTATFNFSRQFDMHNLMATNALQGKERLKDEYGRAIHPTQKPLAVIKKLISVSSNSGDIVLDPFMGVGSTAVAAKELGRRFIGCEIDSKYHIVGKHRVMN